MGFSLSGLVGEGAQQGLEELLTRQLLEAKAAEEERARRAQEAMQARRQSLEERRFAADEQARSEDMQQSAINDMRGQQDRQRARFTALQGEEDTRDDRTKLQEIIASMADPASRKAAEYASVGGKGGNREWFMSPEDRQREADAARQAALDDEIKLINTRAAAQARTGGGQQGATSEAQSDYTGERNKRALDSAADLIGRVSDWTVGYGSLMAALPTSDAADFNADLKHLKATISFNELAQMRAASKTGGALGSVSNQELGLLEASLAGLDTNQSPRNFRKNLQQVIDSLQKFEDAKAKYGGGSEVMPAVSSHGGGAASSAFQRYLELKGKK